MAFVDNAFAIVFVLIISCLVGPLTILQRTTRNTNNVKVVPQLKPENLRNPDEEGK